MFGLTRFEWLFLALAVLLCPGIAFGQAASGASAAGASLFERLDRNKDGYLSLEELEGEEARNRNWIAVDRNRDGRISREEFGVVGALPPTQQRSAAAGGSSAPKAEPQPKE
jgi:hypothetical protein